jgi:hypothetical protein
MEPQNTQSTQMDTGEDRIDLLSSWIIENALVRERRKPGFAAPDFCTGIASKRLTSP